MGRRWLQGAGGGLLLLLSFAVTVFGEQPPGLSRQQALAVASGTPESRALHDLLGAEAERCVVTEVERPCDSEWVTCIEEAWVVVFRIREDCLARVDERLRLTLVIDGHTGDVISRYPETMYFTRPEACMIDDDCACYSDAGSANGCVNFIHAGLFFSGEEGGEEGRCRVGECHRKETPGH